MEVESLGTSGFAWPRDSVEALCQQRRVGISPRTVSVGRWELPVGRGSASEGSWP